MLTDLHRSYATFELFLDFHHVLNGFVRSDFENVVIYACVAEATLRPHITPAAKDFDPETGFTGAISRLLVAERTGLPRETVRRKIAAMISRGLLRQAEHGFVAITPQSFAGNAREISAAVARYQNRLSTAQT